MTLTKEAVHKESPDLKEGVLLECRDISISFGGIRAVSDLTFDVRENEVYGIIGPNGAGKTTVFNIITQFYKADSGAVLFREANGNVIDLVSLKTPQVVRKGLVRSFQNIELIRDLSLADNLLVGAHIHFETSVFSQMLRLPAARREERVLREKAMQVLSFLGLTDRADQLAAGQPYGVLKKIELGRALLSDPRLIILDEPAAGLNDTETEDLTGLVHAIKKDYNCSILLIEHDMRFVMDICQRICAMSFGKKLAVGTPEEIRAHPAVQEAYLGEE
ncbi:ABC transporter ATP-binding protein [Papillibacter cinnamivorans]|uniref:Branched-chain amino acid transport system ATP-binding protein n=1 Tax=Papillibacter cinnamivorans DSM 12816 TaxID=1122930 RepID=A0A1W2C3Q6_9FIRM|nr:ABC transporter ATP-binding protein [Papillibacter cinnamivorans]SMC79532.1 branched-chain amino acid transport system ATP-binding protein [Papillibacter cinnamivorans DSM 12816]